MDFLGNLIPPILATFGTIAIAVNAQTPQPNISPKNEPTTTTPPTEEQISPGRHTVTCALTDTDDLKVNEGDRVA